MFLFILTNMSSKNKLVVCLAIDTINELQISKMKTLDINNEHRNGIN